MTTQESMEYNNNSNFNSVPDEGVIPNGTTMAPHALEVVNQVNKRSLASPRRGSDHLYDSPTFQQDLESELVVDEGEPLRLMTRVGPADDGSLEINWFKDGKLLSAGSRFSTIFDRGFIVLDILYTIEDDNGDYVCVAKSHSGTAQSNIAHVRINPESGVDYLTQLPEEMMQEINNLDKNYETGTYHGMEEDKHAAKTIPKFLSQLPNSLTLIQGQPLHIEIFLEHHSDSSLVTEWFKDGMSLKLGSRIDVIYDRGYCALDIAFCYPEDNGDYSCVARNSLGKAETQSCNVTCHPEESIITKSNLTESSISQLKSLENPGEEYARYNDTSVIPMPPSFIEPIDPREISVSEGAPAYFKVTIDPGNGQKLSNDWYHNGEIVKTCSRLTGKLEMNISALNILYTLPSDTGSYICVLFSEHGRVESEPVTLNVQTEKSIILDPQSKGISAIHALEAELNAPKAEMKEDEIITDLPSFIKQLEPIDQLNEGDSVTLTVKVEPANDNSLYVEWYKNENHIINGSRMQISYDRGTATLNIVSAISEDSGDYWLIATNKNGQTQSEKINISCFEGEKIVTASSLLADSAGYQRLKDLEEDLASGNISTFQNTEDVQEECLPNFDVKPMNITAGEGGPAKFLVKVSGFPTPTLEWRIDDVLVVPDSVCKTYNDGSINYLEINRCSELGDIKVHVAATNPLGVAKEEATLTVIPMVDFRPDLRHITPENPFKKMAGLKKVECTSELNDAFKKSKPTAERIVKIEMGSETKSKFYKSPDVIETEKLYDQVAAGLRKNIGPVSNNGARSPRNNHSGSPSLTTNEEMPSLNPVNY